MRLGICLSGAGQIRKEDAAFSAGKEANRPLSFGPGVRRAALFCAHVKHLFGSFGQKTTLPLTFRPARHV
jgi:hypothetical protein